MSAVPKKISKAKAIKQNSICTIYLQNLPVINTSYTNLSQIRLLTTIAALNPFMRSQSSYGEIMHLASQINVKIFYTKTTPLHTH